MSDCTDCKNKCCFRGPGPWSVVPKEQWLSDGSQNLMCAEFDFKTELCKVWGTDDLPLICETSLCNQRVWSANEVAERHALLWEHVRLREYGEISEPHPFDRELKGDSEC